MLHVFKPSPLDVSQKLGSENPAPDGVLPGIVNTNVSEPMNKKTQYFGRRVAKNDGTFGAARPGDEIWLHLSLSL